MARMIAPMQRYLSARRAVTASGVRGVPALLVAAPAAAHDLERTQVWLGFNADGSFVLDVANDAEWLKLRAGAICGGRRQSCGAFAGVHQNVHFRYQHDVAFHEWHVRFQVATA